MSLADRVGASWRGRSVGRLAGQWQTGCRQAGDGRARNRARARLNWASQGQRWGRCKVRRRAERVSRPTIEKNRRRRVLVVTTGSPRPMRAVQRARLCAITCTASQAGGPIGRLYEIEIELPDYTTRSYRQSTSRKRSKKSRKVVSKTTPNSKSPNRQPGVNQVVKTIEMKPKRARGKSAPRQPKP